MKFKSEDCINKQRNLVKKDLKEKCYNLSTAKINMPELPEVETMRMQSRKVSCWVLPYQVLK